MNDQAEDQADAEQQILALSMKLQLQFLDVLNGGQWSQVPTIAAHGTAEILVKVLRAIVTLEPERQPWALTMVEHVRQAVLIAQPVTPNDTRH